MDGTFTRISPAEFAEKVGIPAGWFVISHRWMGDKKQRRLSHGKWFKIKSEHTTIYRILRFSPNLEGGPKQNTGQMVLDWPGWIDLWGRAEDVDRALDLEFTEAKRWEYPKMAMSHPDPTHRLAGELGLLSVFLGLLSVILAMAALW